MNISENNYSNPRKTLWMLALFCIAAFFLFLGSALFNTRGEPREAIVAVSMLDNGDWILPVNNGTEIAFKPPLLHWCIAAASTLTGAVTEYTSRLPSALSLCLMTLCLFAFFAKRSDGRAALLTALITLTNFEVHRAGYACRVDMLLAALMVLALLALYRWWERGLRGVPWAAAACLAGAALTKGPVGALLPCACAGLFYLLRGVKLWSAVWRLTLVALAALLPLAAWYCAAYVQPHGGERFLQLIYEENVLRLMGKMTYESHINPWWYNVQTVLVGMLPYTLLLLIAPFVIKRGKQARGRTAAKHVCVAKSKGLLQKDAGCAPVCSDVRGGDLRVLLHSGKQAQHLPAAALSVPVVFRGGGHPVARAKAGGRGARVLRHRCHARHRAHLIIYMYTGGTCAREYCGSRPPRRPERCLLPCLAATCLVANGSHRRAADGGLALFL